MTPAQARIKGAVQRHGENYTTGGNTRRGIFTLLTPGKAREFLIDADVDAAGRPIRRAWVPYDDVTSAGASVTVGGVTQTVAKAIDLRHLGAVIGRMLIRT